MNSEQEIRENPEQWAIVQEQLRTVFPERYTKKDKLMNDQVVNTIYVTDEKASQRVGEGKVTPAIAIENAERLTPEQLDAVINTPTVYREDDIAEAFVEPSPEDSREVK